MTTTMSETLTRAAARAGAWTPRALGVLPVDLAELLAAGHVRRVGGPGLAVYELTPAGIAAARAAGQA